MHYIDVLWGGVAFTFAANITPSLTDGCSDVEVTQLAPVPTATKTQCLCGIPSASDLQTVAQHTALEMAQAHDFRP